MLATINKLPNDKEQLRQMVLNMRSQLQEMGKKNNVHEEESQNQDELISAFNERLEILQAERDTLMQALHNLKEKSMASEKDAGSRKLF